jgi:hypothetical protein
MEEVVLVALGMGGEGKSEVVIFGLIFGLFVENSTRYRRGFSKI